LASEQSTARLKRLEQILAHRRHGAPLATHSDSAAGHLESIPVERIRELTTELSSKTAERDDAFDALTLQLLLNEYVAAVGHLRAVARLAAERIDGAAMPMKHARRAVHRLMKSHNAAPVPRRAENAPHVSDAVPPEPPESA
jgi:hypothetical protein